MNELENEDYTIYEFQPIVVNIEIENEGLLEIKVAEDEMELAELMVLAEDVNSAKTMAEKENLIKNYSKTLTSEEVRLKLLGLSVALEQAIGDESKSEFNNNNIKIKKNKNSKKIAKKSKRKNRKK